MGETVCQVALIVLKGIHGSVEYILFPAQKCRDKNCCRKEQSQNTEIQSAYRLCPAVYPAYSYKAVFLPVYFYTVNGIVLIYKSADVF